MNRPRDLRLQWRVSRSPIGGVPFGSSVSIEGFTVEWSEDLPAATVYDSGGTQVGVLLGWPADHLARSMVGSALHVNGTVDSENVDQIVEEQILRLSGSWLFVLVTTFAKRVYLDAAGSLSAVYSPDTGVAGATAGAILTEDEYGSRFRDDLYHHLDIRGNGWFPAGLTAHTSVNRLLVNHYLDLENWTINRHWPMESFASNQTPEELAHGITKSIKDITATFFNGRSAVHTLTGGYDSRYILAALLDEGIEPRCITLSLPGSALDVHIARQICANEGLTHEILPTVMADPQPQELWHARAGHCVGGPNMRFHKTVLQASNVDCLIVGIAGEVGRGFYWRDSDEAQSPLTAQTLEHRLGMPSHSSVRSAISDWLAGLPELDTLTKLDLAYLELRVGPWAFASSYSDPEMPRISPFACRDVIERMLSLPESWRSGNGLMDSEIRRICPQLMAAEVNRYGDIRDYRDLLMKPIRDPSAIVRKIRQRFG